MATKKKEEEKPFTVSNVNNNTNNVNVKVEYPKQRRRPPAPKQTKPNWVKKAIVIGIISLTLSLIGYFIKQHFDEQTGEAPIIHNSNPVQPN